MEVNQKISLLSKHDIIVDFDHVKGGARIKVYIRGRVKQYQKIVPLELINHKDWSKNPIGKTIDYFIKKLGY